MNLLIISHTPHYRDSKQALVAWGPTVKENDMLAGIFNKVSIIGISHSGPATPIYEPYQSDNISYTGLRASGGNTFFAKIGSIPFLVQYFLAIRKSVQKIKSEDWIYVRSPCNVALISMVILIFFKRGNRCIKYAGNWQAYSKEPISYRLQKWVIRRNLVGGVATINGAWPNQPRHILSFLNPCIYNRELKNAQVNTENKTLGSPLKILFVGRIEIEKGVYRVLKILEELYQKGVEFQATLIGEGPEFNALQKHQHSPNITLLGWMAHTDLHDYYKNSHLFLFPSTASEGWPKVLSEAMAFKCIPITSKTSSIPMLLKKFDCGISLDLDPEQWVNKILWFLQNPHIWLRDAEKSQKAAAHFTYEAYQNKFRTLVGLPL